MFLCRAFPTKSRPECLTVGQTACFRSFPAQRDGRRPLLLSSIYPHWGLMSPGEEKKKKIFKQPRCFGHLWSRRSDGSSSSAELMLNNGAKALDPLTPPPRLCSPWEREEQTNARKEDNGIGQDVPGVLSSGAAEPGLVSATLRELCLPSNATRRHRSHAGLLSRAREDGERAAVDKQVGGKMTKPGQQRQSQARPGEAATV